MIRAILIDDEEDARESLRMLLEKFCPQVEIVDICDGSQIGLLSIQEHDPDLVFLDVQMPHMSGFDLLRQFSSPRFQTIFVTAHDKYAIKAIRFSALDYLLKPIDVDELVSAVGRAAKAENQTHDYQGILHNVKHQLGQQGKLAIPTGEGMAFIDLSDLIHCTADGSYTQIHLEGRQPMLVAKRLKEFENILSPTMFCRVHHSAIINLSHIDRYVKGEGGYVIMSNGQHVDISRRKKEAFLKLVARL